MDLEPCEFNIAIMYELDNIQVVPDSYDFEYLDANYNKFVLAHMKWDGEKITVIETQKKDE